MLNIFFELPPRQPPSTPFPYTTLFRSRLATRSACAATTARRCPWVSRSGRSAPGVERPERDTHGHLLDRKSTRLNSSHTVISYAVFCLKKKTRRDHTTKLLFAIATTVV